MNIVIPINSSNFNILLLKKNIEIYTRVGVSLYLSIMGAGINHIKNNLKSIDLGETIVTYDNNTFNYSYAVNRILRKLNNEDIIIIGDFWIPSSLWQIESDLKNINLKEDFLIINTYKDQKNFGKPINLKSKKFMASLATRLTRMHNKKEDIPIIISSVYNIKKYINGLEETIPTAAARHLLKYKLEEFGFNKVISEKETLNLQSINYNLNIINKYISNDLMFLECNIKNKKWGIDLPTSTPIETNLDISSDKSKNSKYMNKPISKIKAAPKKIQTQPKNIKTLLLINSDIKSIIESSRILKLLKYNDNSNIDILTTNKENNIARLFPSYLINYVYSIKDLSKNIIKFNQYNKILNFNSNIKLPKNIIAQDIKCNDLFQPECNYIYPNRSILPGTIFIANTQFNNIPYIWDNFEILLHKLFEKFPKIILYNHPTEKEICNKNIFNSYNNLIKLNTLDLREIVGIMKQCKLVLTNQNTDTYWLARGANISTLLYEGPKSNLPISNNTTIKHNRSCNKCDICNCDDYKCLLDLDMNNIISIIYNNI